MKGKRGFTLIELSLACAILTIAFLGAWAFVSNAQRHQRMLWEELVAHELAVAVVEREWARSSLAPTPAEGRSVHVEGTDLADVQAVLHILTVPGSKGTLAVKAIVTWRREGRSRQKKVMAFSSCRRVRR
jgi:prepilin-type N-terminal cleavage/methylation domain-containing protein